jgi:hypothetical protein
MSDTSEKKRLEGARKQKNLSEKWGLICRVLVKKDIKHGRHKM